MCLVDGCDKKPIAKGLCAKHYMRQRRTGDPTLTMRIARATCAKITKLEAENTELRELLGEMRQQRDAWREIAERTGVLKQLAAH
jgi:hypothetical protein